MEINKLDDNQLENEIKKYRENVDSLTNMIKSINDSVANSALQTHLYRANMFLHTLQSERHSRISFLKRDKNIVLENILFQSSKHVEKEYMVNTGLSNETSGKFRVGNKMIRLERDASSEKSFILTVLNLDVYNENELEEYEFGPMKFEFHTFSNDNVVFGGEGDNWHYSFTLTYKAEEIEECRLNERSLEKNEVVVFRRN